MSTVMLQSADGSTFRGVLAVADDARGAGVVILPDRDGLRAFHAELAGRCAAAGHHAIAIDRADIPAATELIGLRTGARSHVVIGFGLGGARALRAACDPELDLAGVVAVSPVRRPGAARTAVVPVLALFGGEDDAGGVAALGAALAEADVERELVTYHGAPRGFLEAGGHAAADAWHRILGFLEPAALERVA
jgi:carboxymethylenebutenolidase